MRSTTIVHLSGTAQILSAPAARRVDLDLGRHVLPVAAARANLRRRSPLGTGLVAQGESARLTRGRSLVRTQPGPPLARRSAPFTDGPQSLLVPQIDLRCVFKQPVAGYCIQSRRARKVANGRGPCPCIPDGTASISLSAQVAKVGDEAEETSGKATDFGWHRGRGHRGSRLGRLFEQQVRHERKQQQRAGCGGASACPGGSKVIIDGQTQNVAGQASCTQVMAISASGSVIRLPALARL